MESGNTVMKLLESACGPLMMTAFDMAVKVYGREVGKEREAEKFSRERL
jgi:hypothetical protein